jgi:hypothetical protein
MEIYTQLHSTLLLNERKLLVDVVGWASYTFSTERFEEFLRDHYEISREYFSIAGFKHEIIYSSNAVDSLGGKLVIGKRNTFPDTKVIIDRYEYWQNEFANDSRVTYRPWVKEN